METYRFNPKYSIVPFGGGWIGRVKATIPTSEIVGECWGEYRTQKGPAQPNLQGFIAIRSGRLHVYMHMHSRQYELQDGKQVHDLVLVTDDEREVAEYASKCNKNVWQYLLPNGIRRGDFPFTVGDYKANATVVGKVGGTGIYKDDDLVEFVVIAPGGKIWTHKGQWSDAFKCAQTIRRMAAAIEKA